MPHYIYVLSTKGRELLGVEGYHRPYKMRALSFSHLRHHLSLTRFVCSALVWCREYPQVRIADMRLCFDLARELAKGAEKRTDEKPSADKPAPTFVVPDGWINFELLEKGAHLAYVPIWVEIDRGSEYRLRFQQHVEDRIAFIRSEKYAKFFNTDSVRIAYATTGTIPDSRERRLFAMRAWAMELLEKLDLTKWENVFYFTAIDYEDIYNLWHFSEPVWQTPTDPTRRYLLEP